MTRYLQSLASVAAFGAALSLAATAGAAEDFDLEAALSDRTLGDADAPVTIIEYSSLSCPHCASFHRETLPDLKETYIDTGQVQLVYRDFPFDGPSLMGAMLARCAPEQAYFEIIELLFQNQNEWARAEDWQQRLFRTGEVAGLDGEQLSQCLNNEDLAEGILAMRETAQQDYDVAATPTFIIDDGAERIEGARPFAEFQEVLEGRLN